MRKDYKCEGCGGTMLFDPERQLIACEYCEKTSNIGKPIEERKIRVPYSVDLKYEGYKDAKRLYECNSCKTRMASCLDTPVTRCPSCGSNDIFESQADGSHPMNIIPFSVSKKVGSSLFNKWIKSRKFAPNDLKKMAKLQKISGMYVPVYIFDLDAHTDYSATCVEVHESTDFKGRKTSHSHTYHVSESEDKHFDDYVLTANDAVPSYVFKKMKGFDLEGARGYVSDYMLGFVGVGTNMNIHSAKNMMVEKVTREEHDRLKSRLHARYDEVRFFRADTTIDNIYNTYCYVPVWANHYKYKNKDYHCYINGQTGKVYGKSPKSFWKILFFILGLAGAVGFLAWFFSNF